ncbi:unnamed protein product [Polarella glacialis]|nr:unnamed protein product [Polarella glacialis]
MKYFEACLAGVSREDEVEISVHCDISVFEWLADYMKDPQKAESLAASNVVSMLISSDFLQMHQLVDKCLTVLHRSINDVVKLPLDLACLPNRIVARLAAMFRDDELEDVQDSRDKLLSRLYAHKLEELLTQNGNVLYCCTRCQCLFSERQRSFLTCTLAARRGEAARPTESLRVPAKSQHQARVDWDVSQHLRQCRENLQLNWRQIYWRVWGQLQLVQCSSCQVYFQGLHMEQCCFHPKEPLWQAAPHAHVGTYPCCNKQVFHLGGQPRGCCVKSHTPAGPEDCLVSQKLLRYGPVICGPGLEGKEDRDAKEEGKDCGDEARGCLERTEDEKIPSDSDCQDGGPGCFKYCYDPLPEYKPGLRRAGQVKLRARRSSQARAQQQRSPEDGVERSPGASSRQPSFGRMSSSPQLSEVPGDAESSSFFQLPLPRGVSGQRRLHHLKDILKEDDRRRMDDLTTRVQLCSAGAAQRDQESGGPNERQARRLSWIGNAAAADSVAAAAAAAKAAAARKQPAAT